AYAYPVYCLIPALSLRLCAFAFKLFSKMEAILDPSLNPLCAFVFFVVKIVYDRKTFYTLLCVADRSARYQSCTDGRVGPLWRNRAWAGRSTVLDLEPIPGLGLL